jgi:hypothetical protein
MTYARSNEVKPTLEGNELLRSNWRIVLEAFLGNM